MGEIIHHLAVFTKQQNRVLQNFFPICCRQILLNLCPATEKGNINSRSNINYPSLWQWNFGLYVSGFWHIHAKTPRGTVATE